MPIVPDSGVTHIASQVKAMWAAIRGAGGGGDEGMAESLAALEESQARAAQQEKAITNLRERAQQKITRLETDNKALMDK